MYCKAQKYNDQMICGKCGLQWDVDDPDPPACKPTQNRKPLLQESSPQENLDRLRRICREGDQ